MPFHFFPPPHLHILPIALTSALAFAAGAYAFSKNAVPAGLQRLAGQLKASAKRRADQPQFMFARGAGESRSTVNTAFEDYRAAQLKGLEAEAAEFRAYLDNLRNATDKNEFRAFLDERRQRPGVQQQQS